jgi:plasmid stabilization system protein ParE
MKFTFHPEAEREFIEAVRYYENAEHGTGRRFIIEVYATIQNILAFPYSWPKISGEIRRCLVHHFPYGVLYYFEQDDLIILAVMHLQRRPDYWKTRN